MTASCRFAQYHRPDAPVHTVRPSFLYASLQTATGVALHGALHLSVELAVYSPVRSPSLADPAVGFGGGQLGEVTQARVPPKLKTPRIWPTIFWEWPKITYKNKNIKKENKKVRLQVSGLSWKSMVSPVGPRFVLRAVICFGWALVCHEEI